VGFPDSISTYDYLAGAIGFTDNSVLQSGDLTISAIGNVAGNVLIDNSQSERFNRGATL
jgi:hypothetical protein